MNNIEDTGEKRWRWYHGVAFYAGVQAVSFGLGSLTRRAGSTSSPQIGESLTGNDANDAFYNRLVRPVFAPDDWVFPPVWIVNNALCIWGLLRALNMPQDRPGRTAFLALQATVWLCFAAFNASYFGLRSPINGAVNTNIGLLATLASMYVAAARLKDGRVVVSQSTILPWLLLASATATSVAMWNRDEFWQAGPFTEPAARWKKGGTEK